MNHHHSLLKRTK